MAEMYAHTAHAYAEAVVAVLAEEFSHVTTGSSLGRIILQDVAHQAQNQSRSFEVIVTYTREWRLTTETTGWGRSRVRLACYKDRPTGEDARLERRVNEVLRAIKLED
jgi:hypothetical protein